MGGGYDLGDDGELVCDVFFEWKYIGCVGFVVFVGSFLVSIFVEEVF